MLCKERESSIRNASLLPKVRYAKSVPIWGGRLRFRVSRLVGVNRCDRQLGGDFADVDGDAVGIFYFEGRLLQVIGIEGGLAAQTVGINRVAHVAQAAGGGGNVRDSHADMQIVEHAGHVFGTVVALVLEYGEVVVAVGQVVADSSLASDLKPQTISPEADRLGEIGRSYSYMDQDAHSFVSLHGHCEGQNCSRWRKSR